MLLLNHLRCCALAALCLVVTAGCTIIDRIIIFNNCDTVVTLIKSRGERTEIQPGGRAVIRLGFEVDKTQIEVSGRKLQAAKWSMSPENMFEKPSFGHVAGLSLTKDLRLYALDLSRGDKGVLPPEQPSGFPIVLY